MALSANILSGLIQTNLESFGADGENLKKFCDGVAAGIVQSIVGKTFTTSDVGTTPGNGTGTGTGILSLSSTDMQTMALSLMSSTGVNAGNLMQAIMDATVSHLSGAAHLTSVNSPVYLGIGTIDVGSITVDTDEMSNNIDAQLLATGANGAKRTELSIAIGTAIASNILAVGTGTLTITGSPTGDPTPGSGSGTGTIS